MQPSTYYHVYNRANGYENLFRQEKNYNFFLGKFRQHISPVADAYAYCLLPNHFHFLIRTKSKVEIETTFGKLETFQKLEERISKQFSNLFSSYTQSYNKVYERKGSLFVPNFKKKEITSYKYLTNVIHYIHSNPVHHGFVKDIYDWPHSSFHTFFSNKNTILKRDDVLRLYGGIDMFINTHKEVIDRSMALELEF
jgi:putative transposase